MSNEHEIWQFITSRLKTGEPVILLVVAKSAGSSPGRAGYKMAVAADGDLVGSIGGGVMEVSLVEQAKADLSEPGAVATGFRDSAIKEQVHQKNSPNASGMICSGKQTIIFKQLGANHLMTVNAIIHTLENREPRYLSISMTEFTAGPPKGGTPDEDFQFEKIGEMEFKYIEKLGAKNHLYIVGGGHCSLALSELMSRMDFHIRIFDDRPELNTIEKNRFADEITIIDGYESVGELIQEGSNVYVVVMTLGYASDEVVIRQMIGHELKYLGVLGSRAKMKVLLTALEKAGFPKEKLDRIHTPIGLPINSHTPEEIAVSIAAEIIAIKNAE